MQKMYNGVFPMPCIQSIGDNAMMNFPIKSQCGYNNNSNNNNNNNNNNNLSPHNNPD